MDQHTVSAESPFQMKAIGLLRESATNPRRHFAEQPLNELAANVKRQGVLLPLLVRPQDEDHYEIIAGARRFRAAKIAELTEVPVRICHMSDAEVLEVQVIENLQREDIHPVEEAEGFQTLIDKYGYTPSTLAERCSRSESYIQKRLALSKLVDEVKQAFLDGRLELGHALLLCRLTAKDQRAAFGDIFEKQTRWQNGKEVVLGTSTMSVSQLRLHIEQHVFLDLSGAPWKKDDKALVKKAGACNACSKRTGSNLVLFDDAKKGDHCLDRVCWSSKMQAHIVATQKRFAADNKPLVNIATSYASDLSQDVLSPGSYKLISGTGKPKSCKYKQDALVVFGSQLGFVLPICQNKDCDSHWQSWERCGGSGSKAEKSFKVIWEEKRERHLAQVDLEARRALFRELVSDSTELDRGMPMWRLIASKLIDRAGHDGSIAVCAALRIDVDKSGVHSGGDPRGTLNKYAEGLALDQLIRFCFALCHHSKLLYGGIAELRAMVTELERDPVVIEREATAALVDAFEKKYKRAKAAEDSKKKQSGKGEKVDA